MVDIIYLKKFLGINNLNNFPFCRFKVKCEPTWQHVQQYLFLSQEVLFYIDIVRCISDQWPSTHMG